MAYKGKSKKKGSFKTNFDKEWEMPPEEEEVPIQPSVFRPAEPENQNKALTAILEAVAKIGRKFDHVERLHNEALTKIDIMGRDIRELELSVKIIHDWVLELKSARTRETFELPGGNIPEGKMH